MAAAIATASAAAAASSSSSQQMIETKQKEIVVNTEIKITEIVKQEISKPDKELIDSINKQKKEFDSKNFDSNRAFVVKTPDFVANTEAIVNQIKNTINNKDILKSESMSVLAPKKVDPLTMFTKSFSNISSSQRCPLVSADIFKLSKTPEIKTKEIPDVCLMVAESPKLIPDVSTSSESLKNLTIISESINQTISTTHEMKSEAIPENKIETTEIAPKQDLGSLLELSCPLKTNNEINTEIITTKPEEITKSLDVSQNTNAVDLQIQTQTQTVQSEATPVTLITPASVPEANYLPAQTTPSVEPVLTPNPNVESQLQPQSNSIEIANTTIELQQPQQITDAVNTIVTETETNQSNITSPTLLVETPQSNQVAELPAPQPTQLPQTPLLPAEVVVVLPASAAAAVELPPPPPPTVQLPPPALGAELPPPAVPIELPPPAVPIELPPPAVAAEFPPPAEFPLPAVAAEFQPQEANSFETPLSPPIPINQMNTDQLIEKIAQNLETNRTAAIEELKSARLLEENANQELLKKETNITQTTTQVVNTITEVSQPEPIKEFTETPLNMPNEDLKTENTSIPELVIPEANETIPIIPPPMQVIEPITTTISPELNSSIKSPELVVENLNETQKESNKQKEDTQLLASPAEVVSTNTSLTTDDLIEKIAKKIETHQLAKIEPQNKTSYSPLIVNQELAAVLKEPSNLFVDEVKEEAKRLEIANPPPPTPPPKTPVPVPFKTALKFPPVLLNNVHQF